MNQSENLMDRKIEPKDLEIECLREALTYAMWTIESYQIDIRNSQWLGVDLVSLGFCQGTIYTGALEKIFRLQKAERQKVSEANSEIRPSEARRAFHNV